jgi:hypothetical protein
MNQTIRNAIRSVKGFFVEPAPDFGFDAPGHGTLAADPLFDQLNEPTSDRLFDSVALAPTATRNQQSNQEAVLNALARATENYFLANVAPLLRNVPNLRWQIKQTQIRETADNMHLLTELSKLSPSILNAISKAVLCKLPCSHAMDMSQYYGLSIVPDKELIGREVVMWAHLGQDKIAMQFHFDDDIFDSGDAAPAVAGDNLSAAGIPAGAASFHLRLHDERGARDISLTRFPAIIGSAPTADVQVSGKFVSAQHLVLNWDALLQCVFLVDRSKHGTYMKSGRHLVDGDRVNLLGEGQFKLTDQIDALRFEYWHGAAPGHGTALLPEVRDAMPYFKKYSPADLVAAAKPVDAAPTASPAAKSPRAAGMHSAPSAGTRICAPSAAQPTLLADTRSAAQSRPFAWLQVRNAQKQIETVPIATLPFSIGREFDGDGFPVDESYIKVSRTHLRLIEQRGAGFGVSNESLQRPGKRNLTWGEKGTESRQFIWTPQPGNSSGGWRVLGSSCLDGESIEVRLLAADSANGNQT